MANLSDFKVGDVLLTFGLDMGCHKCVCKTEVVKIDERGIVTYDGDCRMLATWDDMRYFNDYFLYSEEQEMAMQEQCDNEYNEWRNACKRQAERAEKYCMERNEKTKRIIKEKGHFDGTHTIFELSKKSDFFRWKKYVIHSINEELNVFGVAEDGDTMLLPMDDLCVPTQWQIESEVDNAAA